MGNSVVHHILLLLLGFVHTATGTLPSVKSHVVHVLFPLLLLFLFTSFPLRLEIFVDLLVPLLEEKLLLLSLLVRRTKAIPARLSH